jgi:hypothetical protein
LEVKVMAGNYAQVPTALYNDPKYQDLGLAEIAVYAYLYDLSRLAKKIGQVDNCGRTYVNLTSSRAMEKFRCSKNTLKKYYSKLEKFGLISRERDGGNEAYRLYINALTPPETFKKAEAKPSKAAESQSAPAVETVENSVAEGIFSTSESKKKTGQGLENGPLEDQKKTHACNIYNNIYNTPIIKINTKPDQTKQEKGFKLRIGNKNSKKFEEFKSEVKNQVNYNSILGEIEYCAMNVSRKISVLDKIVELLADSVSGRQSILRVNSQNMSYQEVSCRFAELERWHIAYAVDVLDMAALDPEIRDKASYALTVLYNAPERARRSFDTHVYGVG